MSLSLLSPEARLLLYVATAAVDPAVLVATARKVRSWPLLVVLAERERACGTIWRALAPFAGEVDADGLASLRRVALVEAFRGKRQRARLTGVLQTLAAADIPVMLLKGAALGTTVYASFEERAMSDLDVLVRPADGARALEALVDAGWHHDRESFPMEMYAGHHHLPPLSDPQHGSVVLEAHTALFPQESPFVLGASELWRDAQRVSVDGRETFVPSAVHLAVHASVHLTWSHILASGGWRTLRDLSALRGAGGLEWSALVDGARAARATTCCYWPLALARATGVLDVPDDVLATLQPRLPAAALAMLTRHFLLQLFAPGISCPSARLRRSLWTLAVQPRRLGAPTARPWSSDARFARFGGRAVSRTRGQAVAAWGNYLRLAVTGRVPG